MTSDELLAQEFGTLPDLLRAHARARPAHPALVLDDQVLDAAALDAQADRVAAALQRDGVRAGEVVALCAGNSVEWVVAFCGALRAGAVAAPLPPSATGAVLARMCADADARVLFVDGPAALALDAHRADLAARQVSLDGTGGAATLAAWAGLGAGQRTEAGGAAAEAVAGASRGARPTPVALGPSDPCTLIYSSGTTGTPKGIVQPQSMRWAHVRRGALLGYGPRAVTLVALPLWSNTTLVSLLPALGLGGTVVLLRRFDAVRFLQQAARHRVTHAMLVPVLFQRLLAHEEFARADLSSFELKTCTSAPFPASLKAEVLRRWPGGLVEFYGMSEGGASCMLAAHLHPDKLHTVGRPQPGHEVRLIDDDGREVPEGEPGEVVGRSPMMMTGYHRLPEATAQAEWFDAAGRRFIRTGDVGRLDEDGFVTLVDRKKDLVISGGANVYPSDLEEVLRGHPAVLEVAVVGVPSERWGETPVAFVAPAAGEVATAAELLSFANARLGKLQRLSGVELVERLPRSAVGKVLKRELREEHARRRGASPSRPIDSRRARGEPPRMVFDSGLLHVESTEDGTVLRHHWSGRATELRPAAALDGYFASVLERARDSGLTLEHHFEGLEYFNSSFISWLVRHVRRTLEVQVRTVVLYDPKSSMHRSSFDALKHLQHENAWLEVREAPSAP